MSDPLELMDNDFNVIGNVITSSRNIFRRGNLSVKQVLTGAKFITTAEVLSVVDWTCPYCNAVNRCHKCGTPRPKYLYEGDVYAGFFANLINLSLSQDSKALDLLGKIYSGVVKGKLKDKKDEKLDND